MKPETDPITDDEHLLRLVWHDRFTAKLPVISPGTFEPRTGGLHPDTDGLSMFREACLASPTDALAVIPEEKRSRYGIVRIPVARLAKLGLTVRPSRIETVPGHVVIPELNSVDYADKSKKSIFKATQLRLAEIASENIVHQPETG
jgi:hypothetical protein